MDNYSVCNSSQIYYMNQEAGYLVKPSVHVNPHFSKKVYVNPNFQTSNLISPVPKIHINPSMQSVRIPHNGASKIHINPNVLRNIPKATLTAAENTKKDCETTVYATRTKLIQTAVQKRRVSIHSKYKIVKSGDIKIGISGRLKLVKCSPIASLRSGNKFKLDNRIRKQSCVSLSRKTSRKDSSSKYKLSLVKIGGDLYRKTANKLQKASVSKRTRRCSALRNHSRTVCKSKYRIVKVAANPTVTRKVNEVKSRLRLKKVVSPKKLRKCNIPCPIYKKFGKCRANDLGKCFRKHDPAQIALCTRFLQGACVNEKCPLSHNVSSEKMPTCKFYLEGNCSKDDCPYLHVRISPKADICRDFLEGFCKLGAECNRRHQFLCPEYEKSGSCPKQRCSYPHGKTVRKFWVFDKYKLAKKCSGRNETQADAVVERLTAKTRYYVETKGPEDRANETGNLANGDVKSRPKLGELPSFIAFRES